MVYYVSPQIWAWRQGRVKKIARRVDAMLTLFPFEVPLYTAAGLAAECVGHPLVDRLQTLPTPEQAAEMCGLDGRRPTVALLPGSRRQEIQRLLPPMLKAFQLITERLPHTRGSSLWRQPYNVPRCTAIWGLAGSDRPPGAQYPGTLRGDVCHGEFWNGDA